jgi:hypothetical protein
MNIFAHFLDLSQAHPLEYNSPWDNRLVEAYEVGYRLFNFQQNLKLNVPGSDASEVKHALDLVFP